jgi:hypothetical protein
VSGAKILVVANPYEAARIQGWLEGSTLPIARPVRVGDGSDDTLGEFAADPADVVVLSCALEAGDALALAGALRLEGPRELKVILVGDERGPVRTALDAVDFGADRFLRRPLAEKALVFAVRSCLAPSASAGNVAGGLGLGALGGASARDAMSALGELERVRLPAEAAAAAVSGRSNGPAAAAPVAAAAPAAAAPAAAAPAPVPVAPAATPSEPIGGLAAAAVAAPAGALAARLESVTQSMLDEFLTEAVTRTVDAAVGAGVMVAVEYVAEPQDAAAEELSPPSRTGDFLAPPGIAAASATSSADAPTLDDMVVPPPLVPPRPAETAEISHDEASAPPWREPTLILSDGGASAASRAASADASMAIARITPVPVAVAAVPTAPEPALPGTGDTPPPEPPAPAGTLARELRRTMSAIEKRLFGDEGGATSADAPDEPADADADIDLDKIGVSTVPGFVEELSSLPRAPAMAPTLTETGVDDGTLTGAPAARPATTVRVDLAGEDIAAFFARLFREGWSGRVALRRGEAHKSVYLDGGRAVFATSNLPHDRMGDLLYREGKITREQHARSREIVAETGRRMGEILVELGFLKRRELLPAVRRHVEDIFYSLFAWEDGEATLEPGDAAQDEKIRLATHPTALVFEGIRRKYGAARLLARLGPPETIVAPLKRDDVTSALAEADLSLEERAAADLFDGRRSLADAAAATRLDPLVIAQLAYSLVVLGLARAHDRGGRDTDSGARTTVPPPPGVAPSVAASADVAIDRERVLAKHQLVLDADYFAVLGVRRDATAFEIKRAYEAARRDYAAEGFPAELARELAQPLAEIGAVLDEAYRVLRDGRVREQYLANLRE